MTSYIKQSILSNAVQLPINDQQFENIANAVRVLKAAFALEESYDLLIGNYVEVEKEVLAAAASNAVQNLNEYKDFFDLRSTINRRVVNLLTTTRLYLDQVPQRLADCTADPDCARCEFKQRTNEHYDDFFSYRFMEALRNHVQHCGLAVHHLSHDSKWIGESGERVIEISVQPFSEKRHFVADGGFKKKILDEMPEKILLMHAIREYLECIGNLHTLVRHHITDYVLKSRRVISDQISRYSLENNGVTLGLSAFRIDSQGQQEVLPLFLDWDDIRLRLASRNSGLLALSRHVVTGRVR